MLGVCRVGQYGTEGVSIIALPGIRAGQFKIIPAKRSGSIVAI